MCVVRASCVPWEGGSHLVIGEEVSGVVLVRVLVPLRHDLPPRIAHCHCHAHQTSKQVHRQSAAHRQGELQAAPLRLLLPSGCCSPGHGWEAG